MQGPEILTRAPAWSEERAREGLPHEKEVFHVIYRP